MKKAITVLALLFCSLMYSQEAVLDSIQVYNVMPKGNLLETIYEYENLGNTLSKWSSKESSDTFIVKFFYKEEEDGPQKTYTTPYSRVKQ